MRIFDAQIRSDTRNDDDLRNLAYFGTERVVTTAHTPRRFADAAELTTYLDHLLNQETVRLERCGLNASVALGVPWDARPRRAHPEVYTALCTMLQDQRVVAVGEIGACEDSKAQWAHFDRLVRMAIETGLPVIVMPPTGLRINMTYKMMARLGKLGIEPGRCLLNLLDGRLLPTVVEEGFVGGVAVGQRQLEPRAAAAMIADVLDAQPDAATRTILNSSLRREAADILGIPKTVVALSEAGVGDDRLEELVFGNAERFFVRTDR